MTILHVINSLSEGGAETVLYRLCTHDQEYTHVVVSLMDGGKYEPLLEKAGVRVFCLDMPRGRITLGGLWYLWRILRRERPAVVQTWMYHSDLVGGAVARLSGVRRVFWNIRNSNLEPDVSRRTTRMIAKLCAYLSNVIPKGVACCAERARDVHVALGYRADKCQVIPNGYNIDQFHPDIKAGLRLRGEWGIPKAVPLLGMVARFDPQKDHENLLASLKELKERGVIFHCVLIGRDLTSENATFAAWMLQYGLEHEVSLLGPRADIHSVMAALDVHVLSSAFGEAFPNVLAEAMACGTPSITTDVGDAALIVGDTGWVVPPREPGALCDAMENALAKWRSSPTHWADRQCRARERIESDFSIESMVEHYRRFWSGKVSKTPYKKF